jgi:hypothetical protein
MKKFIKWHKLIIGRMQVALRIDNYGSLWLSWIKGFAMGIILMMLLSGCLGTYYLTDAEYSDMRESHASVTYYDNQIYWGWHSGYYYYYGTPHYYPWYYYYNSCPPSHYTHTTHVIITRPVNKPTHRPNRPKVNTHRPNIRTNSNTKVKTNTRVTITPNRNTKVKTNRTNTNRSNKSNNRRPR